MAYWKNKTKFSLNRQKESRTHLIKSVPYSHQKGQFSISSCSKNIYELLVIHWIIPKTLRHIKTCTEKVKVLVTQSCLTLCDPRDCSPTRLLSMEFSRQEYWSEEPFPSQRIFLTLGLLPRRQILYHVSHQGSPSLTVQTYLNMLSTPIKQTSSYSNPCFPLLHTEYWHPVDVSNV